MDENTTPIGDAEAQVAEIFKALTPEQMIANELSIAKTPREFRKVAHGVIHGVCPILDGRSGMSAQEKTEALERSRNLLSLAVDALDRAVELSKEASQ